MAIQDADRKEWAHHPVTQEFLQQLRNSKQDTMEAWASEAFIGEGIEATAMQNATALGGVRVLVEMIDQLEELTKVEEVAV